MVLATNKAYWINVRDDDKNKCSKDCKYMINDCDYGIVCVLERCTSSMVDSEQLKDDNRTDYCKKFFENLRG